MIWHSDSIEHILEQYSVTEEQGLSAEEAAKRLDAAKREQRLQGAAGHPFRLLARALFTPLVLIPLVLCLAAAGFAVYHSSRGTPESIVPALIAAGLVLLAALLRGVLRFAAEHSLASLPKGTGVTATVRRDGNVVSVPAASLVAGDILVLQAGDYVPADCRLLSARLLICDETAFGGDAHVQKAVQDGLEPIAPLAKRVNMLYAGSVIVTGDCVAVAVEITPHTELDRVHPTAAFEGKPIEAQATVLRRRCAQFAYLGAFIFLMVALFCAIPLTDSLLGLAVLLTLGCDWVSPVWLTIYAAALRAAHKQGVSLKSEKAISDLAAIQRIALDKYAFSAPRPAVLTDVCVGNEILRVSGQVTQQGILALLRLAALCTDEAAGEPLDQAILACAAKNGMTAAALREEYPVLSLEPFAAKRRQMEVVRLISGKKLHILKGAPSTVFPLCEALPDNIEVTQVAMRERGLQVLAVAYAYADENDTVETFRFAGLLGFMLAKEPAAKRIGACRAGDILPCMVTGDDATTARAYANQIQLLGEDREPLDRSTIDTLSDAALSRAASGVLYTDMLPATRIRLLRIWKQDGIYVLCGGTQAEDRALLNACTVGAVTADSAPAAKGAAHLLLPSLSLKDQLYAVTWARKMFAHLQMATQVCLAAAIAMALAILAAAILRHTMLLSPLWALGGTIFTCGLLPLLLAVSRIRKDSVPTTVTVPHALRTTVGALVLGVLLAALLTAVYLCMPLAFGLVPTVLLVWLCGSIVSLVCARVWTK